MDLDQVEGDALLPWYADKTRKPPYNISLAILPPETRPRPKRKASAIVTPDLPEEKRTTYQAVACFPWCSDSISDLWGGQMCNERDKKERWEDISDEWMGAVALGGGEKIRVFSTRSATGRSSSFAMFGIEVPGPVSDRDAGVSAIAWSVVFTDEGFDPILAFTANRKLYLYNVRRRQYHGVLRGHGGKILSIAVHPTYPTYICTTSRDHSVRIYDIMQSANFPINNPIWPGGSSRHAEKQCLAGPAFGLRVNEGEGEGFGRCVGVLIGGSSGGHVAPVKNAAFHPTFPLIATCGADNCVKIWLLPPVDGKQLVREDKPLFSSSRIHSAEVLSIHWLNQDILISHSGPIWMRTDQTKKLRKKSGELIVWKWLGLDRFFPPGREVWPKLMRGCASDHQESSSFKIMSQMTLPGPLKPVQLTVHQSLQHPPVIFIPIQYSIRALSPIHFKSSEAKPLFLPEIEDSDLLTAAQNMTLNEQVEENPNHPSDSDEWWRIVAQKEGKRAQSLEACAIGEDGDLLVAVGENEEVWVWRKQS